MAEYFFFTDLDLLNTQAQHEKYGPITSFLDLNSEDPPVNVSPDQKFRVCSLHTFNGNVVPKAYAVCDGEVMIQPIPGDQLVNIILKPDKSLTFDGLRIRYFIYRGIKRDSILNGTEIAPASTSDLTKSIWHDHMVMVETTAGTDHPITGNPSGNIVGMDMENLPPATSIDDLFNHDGDYMIANIKIGESLGFYNKPKAGFEIVLENYFHDVTLGSVRQLDHYIDAGTFVNTMDNKSLREKILSYIDPCAFYGYLYDNLIKGRTSDGTLFEKDGFSTYNEILIPKFVNYNIVYIDIRNENNLSYSYYPSGYDGKLLGFEVKGQSAADNGYNSNSWPIYILNTPSGSYDHYGDNTARLTFGISKKSYQKKPILFFPKVRFNTSTKYHIINQDDEFTTGSFITVEDEKVRLNTLVIVLKDFNHPTEGGHNLAPTYLRMNLFYTEIDVSNPEYSQAILPTDSLVLKNAFLYSERIEVPVDRVLIKKNYHYSYLTYKVDSNRYLTGIFETYTIFENQRVSLISIPTEFITAHRGDLFLPPSVVEGMQEATSFFSLFQKQNKNYVEVGKHELKIGSTQVPYLNFMQVAEKEAGLSEETVLFGISIHKDEYQAIKDAISSNQLNTGYHPVFVFLNSPQTLSDTNNVEYNKASLSLGGWSQSGVVVNEIAAITIDLYSTERLYCSVDSTNLESLSVTSPRKINIGSLHLSLSTSLQTALSTLSIDKQNLFVELFKLSPFTKIINQIAGSTKIRKFVFTHENPGSSDALADCTVSPNPYKSTATAVQMDPYSVSVRIRPSYLASATPIHIIATIMHELMHAKIGFEMTNIVGGYIGLKPEQITKLRKNTININAKLYANYYCKFGSVDDDLDENDNKNERSDQHNFMADYLRDEIEQALIEYEANNLIVRADVSLNLKDVFSETIFPIVLTKDQFYKGLTWGGLAHTRSFRDVAAKGEAPKLFIQLGTVVRFSEQASIPLNPPPSYNISGFTSIDYSPVLTPRTPDCK